MVIIEGKLVSIELFEQYFACDLSACKGACCVAGDAGAPISKEEGQTLDQIFEKVAPYLREEGLEAITEQGTHVWDYDEYTTPLVKGKECAYVIFDGVVAKCGIEKAWEEGEVGFQKPLSCHLYPIRVKKSKDFEALNYNRWGICSPACASGAAMELPVFRFLKGPIIRAYGDSFYEEMETVYASM